MPPQHYQAKVAEHVLFNKDYHWFTIDLSNPTILEFQAGQFIMLDVPGIGPATLDAIRALVTVEPGE